MAKKTIDNTILEYMKKGNRINQWNSYELFQYTRLSATIFNLKAKGYIIKKEWKKAPSGKRYKEYWLVEAEINKYPVEVKEEKKKEPQIGLGFDIEPKKSFEWPD